MFCVMFLPSSHKKSILSLLMAPIVSATIGTNQYNRLSEEYLLLLLHRHSSVDKKKVHADYHCLGEYKVS